MADLTDRSNKLDSQGGVLTKNESPVYKHVLHGNDIHSWNSNLAKEHKAHAKLLPVVIHSRVTRVDAQAS